VAGVERLERVPGDLEPDQRPRRAARALLEQRGATDEVAAVELDRPGQPELERGRLARLEHDLRGAVVVDAEHDEAGLDARDVERVEPRRGEAPGAAGGDQRVPEPERAVALDPHLVAEVAGVAGAADPDLEVVDAGPDDAEEAQGVEVGVARGAQHLARGRALDGDGREPRAGVLEADPIAARGRREPVEGRVGGGQAVVVLAEAGDRAVVDDLAAVVAPAGVGDAADREPGDVAGEHPGEHRRGVGSGHLVLVEGRDVEQPGRLAESEVLAVVGGVVAADGVVAGPVLPAIARAQLLRALVERRRDRHGRVGAPRGGQHSSGRATLRAAPRGGARRLRGS
jgi:hypothetical protein